MCMISLQYIAYEFADKFDMTEEDTLMSQPSSDRSSKKIYAEVRGPYLQRSIKGRIRALFLDNIGRVVTRDQIREVARDPETGREPENWHQRLSELRTDEGYTISAQWKGSWN